MRLRNESDLETALFNHWQELRESGRLDCALPSCRTWERPRGQEMIGYQTLDYKIHRQLRLPGAWGSRKDGIADLVELYWSVRTLNGEQDPSWEPSLNAHVVELKNEPLQMKHVEQLYRYILALRGALVHGGNGLFISKTIERPKISLNVRGVLIGPHVPESVAIIDALSAHADVPIAVASYVLSATEGLVFKRTGTEERFFSAGYEPDRLKVVGGDLISQNSLFLSQEKWSKPQENIAPLLLHKKIVTDDADV